MDGDKRGTYAVVIVAIVLMLLLWRHLSGAHTIINNTSGDAPTITVDSPRNVYVLPPLLSPRGAYDWMQTTDLSCGCDVGLWKAPIVIETVGQVITSYPSYHNIVTQNNVTEYRDAPTFPVYVPPALPTYWDSWGMNVQGEQASYFHTSDGVNVIKGKYSRKDNPRRAGYPDQYADRDMDAWRSQTKMETETGDDLYANGKHYKHDASKDQRKPYWPTATASFG